MFTLFPRNLKTSRDEFSSLIGVDESQTPAMRDFYDCCLAFRIESKQSLEARDLLPFVIDFLPFKTNL